MGHIKEPENVDFIIQSPPLTNKERKAISELIRKLKSKRTVKKKRNTKKETV